MMEMKPAKHVKLHVKEDVKTLKSVILVYLLFLQELVLSVNAPLNFMII